MSETRRRGLLAAIRTEGSPCSPCIHAPKCAAGLLACPEFQRYLKTTGSLLWVGPVLPEGQRVPTRALYARVHAHNPTKAETAWRKAGKERISKRGAS